jgi:hypothetical protein
VVKPETSNGLPPDEIVQRIEKALKHGGDTHTWDDIRQGLIDGHFQLHWNNGGVAITEIQVFPRRKNLHCFVVAGEMESVVALRNDMARFARAHDCKAITASGRIGWERVLPKTGWRKMHSVFTFDPWEE